MVWSWGCKANTAAKSAPTTLELSLLLADYRNEPLLYIPFQGVPDTEQPIQCNRTDAEDRSVL
jgi:hypothetical protein